MAFATTGVLDDFNRADGAPGSNWTTPIWLANSPRIVSNAIVPNVGNNYCDMYWNPATYGNSEVYMTLSTYGSYNWVSLRLGDAGNNYDGYFADTSGGATSTINRRDNGVNTRLGATISQTFASGDSIGLEASVSTITLYRKTGGSWSSVASRTDTTYTTGNIGLGVYNSSVIDDFGGGDIVVPPSGGASKRALMGVGA